MSKRLLVCDLDNTLYDWVTYFVSAFYAMVDEAVKITGCDREQLLDDFREVHREHSDSEHPFALLETQTIKRLFPFESRADVARRLDRAFYAFNSKRKENLRLYPGVKEVLDALSSQGITLVAHTESKLYAVVDRLSRLELTNYFSKVYCRERSIAHHPNPSVGSQWLSRFPMNKVRELSHHQKKPSPEVLLEICADQGITIDQTAYVGDSIARDIMMANDTGVYSIWAKYGTSHHSEAYPLLVRVSHWTEQDILRERELAEKAKGIRPDYVLHTDFSEIEGLFSSEALFQRASS
jgi:phosphoglycolate phosphatase